MDVEDLFFDRNIDNLSHSIDYSKLWRTLIQKEDTDKAYIDKNEFFCVSDTLRSFEKTDLYYLKNRLKYDQFKKNAGLNVGTKVLFFLIGMIILIFGDQSFNYVLNVFSINDERIVAVKLLIVCFCIALATCCTLYLSLYGESKKKQKEMQIKFTILELIDQALMEKDNQFYG